MFTACNVRRKVIAERYRNLLEGIYRVPVLIIFWA